VKTGLAPQNNTEVAVEANVIEGIITSSSSSKPIDLYKACKFACNDDSDIHKLPFPINEKDLLEAIQSLQSLPTSSKIKINNT